MKVLGIIPARGGSKGVIDKNIKLCNGIPLINYTINAALNSNLHDVIVSTDSERIATIAREASAKVPFIRDSSLAQDSSKSIDVVIDALLRYEKLSGVSFDAVMLLQPTCPLRELKHINESIDLLGDGIDSVISVVDVDGNHPARMKKIDQDGFLVDTFFSEVVENQPRQELERFVIRNGAIYLSRRDVVLSGGFKGLKSLAYEMSPFNSINIDNILDFKFAEFLLNENS